MKSAKWWTGWLAAAAMILGVVADTWATGTNGFWARLSIPDPLVRGKISENCFVEYGNSGTTDTLSPVLQVTMRGDGTLGYIGGLSGLQTLQFVAAGEKGNAGVVRAGTTHRIRFALCAGTSNSVSLHSSVGSNYAPAPWTSPAEYLADLSAAATRVGLRGQDATDFYECLPLAISNKLGYSIAAIYGKITNQEGLPIQGVPVAVEGNSNASLGNTISDENGNYVIRFLPPDTYTLRVEGNEAIIQVANTDVSIDFSVDESNSVVVWLDSNPEGMVVVAYPITGGEAIAAREQENGTYILKGLSCDEIYRVEAMWNEVTGSAYVSVEDGETAETRIKLVRSCSISGVIDVFSPEDIPIVIVTSGKDTYTVEVESDGTFSLSSIPSGEYTFLHVSAESIESPDVNPIAIKGGEHAMVRIARNGSGAEIVSVTKMTTLKRGTSTSDYEDIKWYQTARGVAAGLVSEGKALWQSGIANEPMSPSGAYDCVHNRAKFKTDVSHLQDFTGEFLDFQRAYNLTDTKWLWVANISRTIGVVADVAGSIYFKCQKALAVRNLKAFEKAMATYDFAAIGLATDSIVATMKAAVGASIGLAEGLVVAGDATDGIAQLVRLKTYAKQIEKGCKRVRAVSKTAKSLEFLSTGLEAVSSVLSLWEAGSGLGETIAQEQFSADDLRNKIPHFRKVLAKYSTIFPKFNNYMFCCVEIFPEKPYEPPVETVFPEVWDGRQQAWYQDLVLVIDSTGSMDSAIQSAKSSARRIVQTVLGDGVQSGNRIAVVEYRDKGDAFVYRTRSKFTANASTAISAINGISIDGGGDTPEALYAALRAVAEGGAGEWRNVNKNIIVMTDAPPHDPDPVTGDTKASIKQLLAKRNIRRSTKGVRQRAKEAESEEDFHVHFIYLDSGASTADIYRELADATGGTCQSGVNPDDAADAIMDALETIADWDPDVEMGDIWVTPRWPWNGMVDIDFTFAPTVKGTKATFTVSGVDGDLGTEVEAKTLSGAYRNLTGGTYRVTWNLGKDAPGFHSSAFTVQMDATIDPLPAPVVEIAGATVTGGITLRWANDGLAESYTVFKAADSGGTDAVEIGTVRAGTAKTESFRDSDAPYGKTVWYAVKVSGWKLDGERSAWVAARRPMQPPTNLSATSGTRTDGVFVKWTPSENTVKSWVFRCAPYSLTIGEYDLGTEICDWPTFPIVETVGSSWLDSTAVPGVNYAYAVVCVSIEGEASDRKNCRHDYGWRNVDPPVITSATRTNSAFFRKPGQYYWGEAYVQWCSTSTFDVAWNAIEGASSYTIKHWPLPSSTNVETVSTTECSFSFTGEWTSTGKKQYGPGRKFRIIPIVDSHEGNATEIEIQ